ncbi:MAG TPA: M20/M25/M40 family metallo-hydrolase, partial [Gemmataceae bacterium]|nr:M20/M25/M40 family metallo-hydrolase [Gemmataceae bacterium]
GFYESVQPVCAEERAYLRQHAPSDADWRRNAGIAQGWGEPGYSLYERAVLRPALTVNGLTAGYQGPGGKAIIPARASAKLSFRLVPNQDPREIGQLLRRYVAHLAPATVRYQMHTRSAARPVLIPRRHPALAAAAHAYRQGFAAAPVFLRSGGTIPVVDMIQRTLNTPPVLMGFALPDDNLHGPNEKLHLPVFHRGVQTSIHFLAALAPDKRCLSVRRLRPDRAKEFTS